MCIEARRQPKRYRHARSALLVDRHSSTFSSVRSPAIVVCPLRPHRPSRLRRVAHWLCVIEHGVAARVPQKTLTYQLPATGRVARHVYLRPAMAGWPFCKGRRPLQADRRERMHTAPAILPCHRPIEVRSARVFGLQSHRHCSDALYMGVLLD